MRAISAGFWIAIILFANASYSEALEVRGKVFYDGGFANGARVYAYESFEDMGAENHVTVSEPAEGKGDFSIDVPEGSYVLIAEWEHDGEDFSCFQPSNPIDVKPGIWVTLLCNRRGTVSISETQGSGGEISGKVTFRGEPLADAYVTIFFDSTPDLRGLGYITLSTEQDGSFETPVHDGKYIVVARKRQNGKGLGPTEKGDIFCYFPGNPVGVSSGQRVAMDIPCMPIKDITMFVRDWDGFVKEADFNPERYAKRYEQAAMAREKSFSCGIRGVVRDESGNPVKGLIVLAHAATSEPVFYMSMLHLKPADGVATTDENGEYFMRLGEPGLYYLMVRQELATSPPRGGYFGQYEDVFHRLEVREGEILEGRDITAVRVLGSPGGSDKRVSGE